MIKSALRITVLAIGLFSCDKSQAPRHDTEPQNQEEAALANKPEADPESTEGVTEPPVVPTSEPETAEEVEPRLVEMLNVAADFGRQGQNAKSLAKYDELLALQKRERLPAAPRFIATAQMQRAYALMDLKRLDEAASALEALDDSTFSGEQLYSYHFSLGNTYGALLKPRKMFSSMVEAISAAEDMDDFSGRPQKCWQQILAFASASEDWAYVVELADKAEQVAGVRNFPNIAMMARATRQVAQEKLKK